MKCHQIPRTSIKLDDFNYTQSPDLSAMARWGFEPYRQSTEAPLYTCVTSSSISVSSILSIKPRDFLLPFSSHTSASSVSCPGFWLLVLIWMHFLLRYISHNSETISATTISLEFFPISLSVNTPSCLR